MNDAQVAVAEMFVDAWNRRDLKAMLKMIDADFEYVNPPNAVETGIRRGAAGLSLVMSTQWETLGDDARQEIERVHHRG